jgi:hypothetical protein
MKAKTAWSLEYDNVHTLCVTPCCGKVVRHGSCRGGHFDGHRSPHCGCNNDYYVKKSEYTKKVNEIREIRK